jgi:hypothetical protein
MTNEKDKQYQHFMLLRVVISIHARPSAAASARHSKPAAKKNSATAGI